MKKNFLNVCICLPVLIFVALACSTLNNGKAASEKAVEKFHSQLNEEKFEEIYDQSAKEFQNSGSREEAVKTLRTIRRRFGTVKKSTTQGWGFKTTPTVKAITMSCETEFSEATAIEDFVFAMDGDEAKLLNYQVNPKK